MLTVNNFYTQKLNLTDHNSVYVKNYRLPYAQRSEIDSQVDGMLKAGVIERSKSCYNSSVVLVPKKSVNGDKRWRLCVDFRQVNKRLKPDKFPLPRIDDNLDNLGRAKFFTVLDLFSGFHQVPLDSSSRDVTSFTTEKGNFRFKVLPFGLSVAPNSFSRMMSLAFSGFGPSQAFLYLDDIIVVGASEAHHLRNLRDVFETCRATNLKLNLEKCDFMKRKVTYLGHKCSDEGILPDSSKFQLVRDYPRPQDKDGVKRFVAFCNYYRKFIPLFADMSC